MFNLFNSNNKSIIDAKILQQLLDEILTSRLEQMGLTKTTNYIWHEQTLKEIRHGFSYNQLKGATGTFTWGVNLDFLPIIHRNKIEYHKAVKKYLHHLFEWPDEYSNSFIGGQLQNGVTTHFGFEDAKKSIATLFDKHQQKIIKWFHTSNLQMVFQYSPAGFEEYFIENGTFVGMAAKERTAEEYAATEKKYGMIYKDSTNR